MKILMSMFINTSVFLSLCGPTHAESLHGLIFQSTALAPGYIRGSSIAENDFASPVVKIITKKAKGPSYCTATVIEGCLLTAEHCLDGGEEVEIEGDVGTVGPIKKAKVDKKADLAMIKLTKPAPKSKTAPFSVLAGTKLKIQDMPQPMVGVGFGVNQIDYHVVGEVKDGDKVKGRRHSDRDRAGTKMAGVMRFERLKDGMVYLLPEPNSTGSGDSGGPLFGLDSTGQVKLVGVAHAGAPSSIGPTVDGKKLSDLGIPPSVFSPVAENAEWISKSFKDLDCALPADKVSDAPIFAGAFDKEKNPSVKFKVTSLQPNENKKMDSLLSKVKAQIIDKKWADVKSAELEKLNSQLKGLFPALKERDIFWFEPKTLSSGYTLVTFSAEDQYTPLGTFTFPPKGPSYLSLGKDRPIFESAFSLDLNRNSKNVILPNLSLDDKTKVMVNVLQRFSSRTGFSVEPEIEVVSIEEKPGPKGTSQTVVKLKLNPLSERVKAALMKSKETHLNGTEIAKVLKAGIVDAPHEKIFLAFEHDEEPIGGKKVGAIKDGECEIFLDGPPAQLEKHAIVVKLNRAGTNEYLSVGSLFGEDLLKRK